MVTIIIITTIVIMIILKITIMIWALNNINNYSNSDNNKGPFSRFLVSSPVKVICVHCNTTQTFGFAGMFPKILFSHFLFYFEPKSNWWPQLFFSFLNDDFNFLEKLLIIIFSFDYNEFGVSIRTLF